MSHKEKKNVIEFLDEQAFYYDKEDEQWFKEKDDQWAKNIPCYKEDAVLNSVHFDFDMQDLDEFLMVLGTEDSSPERVPDPIIPVTPPISGRVQVPSPPRVHAPAPQRVYTSGSSTTRVTGGDIQWHCIWSGPCTDQPPTPLASAEYGVISCHNVGKKSWTYILQKFVPSKNPFQVASHAQKYFKPKNNPKKERKRKSIHDITLEDINTIVTPRIDQHNWVPPPPNFAAQPHEIRHAQPMQQFNQHNPFHQMQQFQHIMPSQMNIYGYSNNWPHDSEHAN
ncbi:hypothetical protein JHK82_023247 [Glycine max]|nr:hypothetical protein JHK85_023784 [Glycine max]KAG5138516.1 hypothetical protein JHK82_023247 [Glycine max]